MAQISYGSITIVDTNDIQRFYVQYAKSDSSAAAPTTGWSQNRPTWQNGTYIWQRTVVKREGVPLANSDYGNPVCITGEKGDTGQQGNTGNGISSIVTVYCNYGNGTPAEGYSGWSSNVPEYDNNKPNYWVKTTINYTSGNPSVTIYKDLGITQATEKANLAVTTAQTANANSIEAISIAGSKNKIYYSNGFPTGGTYINGDTLFKQSNAGTVMYVYDDTYTDATSGHWKQQQFEENAISDLAITNAKIANLNGDKIIANTIAGNKIVAHDITALELATDAIKSSNYVAGTAPFSNRGTFLDLSNGNMYSPVFGVNATENNQGAFIKGSVQAYDGKIGQNQLNYWYIGNYYDYNQLTSAYIKGNGTATIQLGNTSTWRLNTNRIHTAWNDDSQEGQAYKLHYPVYDSKYWDMGLHVPTSKTDKFIYIRNSSSSTSLSNLQNNINDQANGTNNYWNYQFYITSEGVLSAKSLKTINSTFEVTDGGSLYARNIYIKDQNGALTQIGGTDAAYLSKTGGIITGDLTIGNATPGNDQQYNGNLRVIGDFLNRSGNNITLQTNLASTAAATLTGNSTSPISIGITGTLPTSNGGTGNTSYTAGGVVYADGSSPKKLLSTAAGTSGYLLKSGGTGAPTWVDPGTLTVAAATKATQDGDGNVIKTTYLKLTGGNVTGPVSFGDSVSIDDLNAGSLVVTGNASFTNNINANTINGVTVGSNPKFTDTTYAFDNGYSASNNKGATVLTVTNAIGALNVNPINGATNKTLTSISETAGKISATYSNISITKSQVSDFPTSMPASDVSAWAKASTKPSYHFNEIQPVLTKTYTGIIATANDQNNGALYFMKIQPQSYGKTWSIRYKVTATIDGVSVANGSGYESSQVYLNGMRDTYSSYRAWNDITNTSYRPYYYHCFYRAKEAGITNGYGHALGIHLRYSYNPTTAANSRTVTFEILEVEGCTVTFLDAPLTYPNWPGTGSTNYNTYNNFDATTLGMTESGDRNDPNYYNRTYYSSRTTSAALYRYQFCLTKSDGTLIPVNSVNNSVATNKTLTIDSFDPFGEIFYWNSTSTYTANANVGDGALYRQYLADLRYSFNCGGYDTTPTLIARMPLYLVATPQADGTAKLYIEPLSMYLPSSEDGLIYIYLGRVYPDTKPYRVVLSFNHPIYEYRNGAVRLYTGLKSETAVSDGTNVSLVTTGQKYLWNSKTNNTGTVTSVAASGSGGIIISGSPITTSGTLAIGLNLSTAINGLGEGTSAANRDDYAVVQYAGGGTTTTSYHRRKLSNVFKALIADDIPNLAWSKITSGNDDLKAIENLTGTTGLLKKTAANTWTLDTSAYVTSSGVTSITLTQGTGISIGSSGTAITSTGTRTISLADNYGDTKNPYASKTARYVLAAPAAANGVPSFRALTKEDVGLNNVLNYGQITAIGQGDNGTLRVWTGDPTSTSTDDYEDIAITITAYNQSTVSKAGALNLSAAVGSTSKPVYFKADGKPYEISYTIEKSVPSNAVFTDTWNKVSTSQDGYVTKLPGNTTTFLRGDGSWGTPIGTTYTFDGTYNASSNKAATVSTVTNAINALDGNLNNTTPGVGKTLTAFSQTDGKISATFGNISITKSQISDFPSSLTPTSHTHGNISNTGTITSTAVALGNGDNLLFADSSNSGKIERSSITIGTGTTKYLRQDGTWGTPAGTYSLPVATDSTRGGVKIGYSTSGKNYAVQLSSQKMYVNVPWSDTTYSAGTGLSLSGTTFSNSGVTGVKGSNENSYRTGQVNLTPANIGAFESLSYQRGTIEVGVRPLVDQTRANRLAFLPADQIIIEKTTDGGTTWEDAGISDSQKCSLFVNGTSIPIPLLNGEKSTQCGIRITITGMKYNVPQNTSETQKYNYWNNTYVKSQERYFNVREWWFWISANNDTIKPEIYCSTGAKPNNWITIFNTDFGMTGWSGSDWIRAGDGKTFGGGSTQTGNYWNWRLIFWSKFADGKTVFNSTTAQTISTIKCYGDSVWNGSNSLATRDHLYSWDNNKNATFPAQITATQFNGKLNGNANTATTAITAETLTNKALDSLTLNSTAGTFSFQGSGVPWDGTDWVGLQVGSDNDKFQIHALNGTTLEYRQNDSGGTNSNWGDWYTLLSSGNYTDYTVKKDGAGATGSWGISITGTSANVTGTVAVEHGGTGATSFTSGALLIGNGTGAIGTRTIKNLTAKGNLGWTNSNTDIYIPTVNTLAYWDGRYNSSSSNLTYCVKGAFGDAAIKGVVTTLNTSANLPTAGAVSTALGNYVTLTTEQTISGHKTFSNLVTFKDGTGSEYCNINYDQTLDALVFSFG